MPLNPILRIMIRILVDITCLFVAFLWSTWVTLMPEEAWEPWAFSHAIYFIVFGVLWCFTTLNQHLYVPRHGESLSAILFSVARVYFITLVLSGFGLALFLRGEYSRPFFVTFALSTLAIMLTNALVTRPAMLLLRRRYSVCRVLFVGADEHAERLAQVFLTDLDRSHHVVGFLEDDPARGGALEEYGIPYLGKVRELERLLIDRMVDEVYVSLSLGDHYEKVERVAHLCETIGVTVRLAGDIFPIQLAACDITSIRDIPLLSLMTRPRYLTNIQLRRLIEVATAFLLLVALTPLFAVIALLVKLESKGPVLVTKQQPRGNGRRANLWSFRVWSWTPGPEPAAEPPRITRTGQFLRLHGLEDLPQLFNVLFGQTSYMGIPVATATPKPAMGSGEDARWSHLKPRITPTLVLAILDACCVTAAYVLAIRITSLTPTLASLNLTNYLPFWGVLLLAWYAAAIERRLWRWRTVEPLGPATFGLLRAVGNAAIVCGFLLAVLIPGVRSMRRFLVLFCALAFVALLLFRISARFLTRLVYRLGYRIRRIAVVGANERTEQLVQALGSKARFGYEVAGVFENDRMRTDSFGDSGLPCLGEIAALEYVLKEQRVDEVYVTLPVRSQFDVIKYVVSVCERVGMPVHVVGNLLPLNIAKSRAVLIGDIPLISLSSRSETYALLALKRIMDFVASSILIVAFAPLFLILAVLIKLESKGPAFFVQDRIGQNHRHFKMFKFRSMVPNAEELKKDLMHLNEADGPIFKIHSDPRVTRLGRFLRKYSLDELPQIFNVWLGHMSLVGPRPLIAHEVDQFQWFERRRLSVKPGMTGFWQVSGRSDIPFKEGIEMDLAYIDSWSFSRDVLILLKTFKAVLSGRGAV